MVRPLYLDTGKVRQSAADYPNPDEPQFGFASHIAAANPGAFGEVAGNYTVGGSFSVLRNVTIRGARFYWPVSTARTVKCSLREPSGVVLADATIAIAAVGLHEAIFSSPPTIGVPSGSGAVYTIGMWETSGSVYVRAATYPPCVIPNWSGTTLLPLMTSRSIVLENYSHFRGGDANPDFVSGGECYPIEVIV